MIDSDDVFPCFLLSCFCLSYALQYCMVQLQNVVRDVLELVFGKSLYVDYLQCFSLLIVNYLLLVK